MITTTANEALDEQRNEETAERHLLPLREENGEAEHRLRTAFETAAPAQEPGYETQPVLALLCFEGPESEVGRFVSNLAGALSRRQFAVHLFSRHDFPMTGVGVTVHALGDCPGELPEQAQEFSHRACNIFFQLFQSSAAPLTVLGCEWQTVPALSLLRGIRQIETLLSLHSLERQRSDMTSEVSKQIEAFELAGLREAKLLLFHDSAAAEVAKYWVPECASRIENVRKAFAIESFQRPLDAGAVKARYQIGPVDPTILCLGDLSEQYGPDLLVKAMPGILKNHPQARLIVAGEGSLYWPLRVYARYLLLEHAVRLPGSVEGQAMEELIQAADVVVVPSRESTPWWPIQAAWAAHRPVVATHPAAPALVEHDRDSVLVYPSENSLVWGIERVLYDVEFGRTIARKGHDKLEERFGWNAVAAQVEELIGTAQTR